MAGDVKKRTQQKQQLLEQGISPEDVALEAQAQGQVLMSARHSLWASSRDGFSK